MAKPTVTTKFTTLSCTTTVSRLVRENPKRLELIVANTSSAPLYLMLSGLPSSTNYTVVLPYQGVFFTDSTEAVNGVWASSSGGQANITERT